jgi:ring-1,2-phenylacetyl-CoA epoxidase subunit PaaE
MELEVLRVSKSTDDSVSLWFKKDSNLTSYKSGQHGVFSFSIGEHKLIRTYSFHTSPNIDDEVAITVRVVEGGLVSNFLTNTSVDEIKLSLEKIEGGFTLEPSKDIKRHLIMFAGGSGITPIFSMIRSLLHDEQRSTVSLIYSNKTYNKIIFNEELQTLEAEFPTRLKVYHVITQDEDVPAEFPVFYKGRLSKLIVKKIIKTILADVNYHVEYYLCGPYLFMQLVEETIRTIGSDHLTINKEHFFIPDQTPAFDHTALPDRDVVLLINDKEMTITVKSGKSILQASLESGVQVPYSCTEGQCGTCRAKLVSGEVKLRKNHILTNEELKDGQILLCQGFPVSDGIIIKTSL